MARIGENVNIEQPLHSEETIPDTRILRRQTQ